MRLYVVAGRRRVGVFVGEAEESEAGGVAGEKLEALGERRETKTLKRPLFFSLDTLGEKERQQLWICVKYDHLE